MARYYGKIGFVESVEVEDEPGRYVNVTTEYLRYGDILRSGWNASTGTSILDNFTINDRISVVSTREMLKKIQHVAYVEYMDTKWKITSVDTSTPHRLIFTLGGIYNG